MPFQKKLEALQLMPEEITYLRQVAHSRTQGAGRVGRAQMLLSYVEGKTLSAIGREVGVNYRTVSKCVKKPLALGIEGALIDLSRSGRPRNSSTEARTWVVALACTKAKDLGYAAELWTYSALVKHIRLHCQTAGYPALSRISKGTVCKILQAHELKPHKVSYYLERRDPEFERKMLEVLLVYKEVELQNQGEARDDLAQMVTVSCDEKPGIQAIQNVAPDRPPVPRQFPTFARDYEYKRHGTVSLLAGLDLHQGHVFGIIRERHRSCEFIELLKQIDAYYPKDFRIRLLLDNNSSHLSKETRSWLAQHPNRFSLVFTPTHGSWLNLVETLFSKMARTFLRGIRMCSKDELISRILQWIDEINSDPIVPRWSYYPEMTT